MWGILVAWILSGKKMTFLFSLGEVGMGQGSAFCWLEAMLFER